MKIKKEPFKNQLKMQIDINNIQQMVADAVAPLYEQMREIENKYYPNEKDNEKTE